MDAQRLRAIARLLTVGPAEADTRGELRDPHFFTVAMAAIRHIARAAADGRLSEPELADLRIGTVLDLLRKSGVQQAYAEHVKRTNLAMPIAGLGQRAIDVILGVDSEVGASGKASSSSSAAAKPARQDGRADAMAMAAEKGKSSPLESSTEAKKKSGGAEPNRIGRAFHDQFRQELEKRLNSDKVWIRIEVLVPGLSRRHDIAIGLKGDSNPLKRIEAKVSEREDPRSTRVRAIDASLGNVHLVRKHSKTGVVTIDKTKTTEEFFREFATQYPGLVK